ncbi:hypothetical protein LCGC14_2402440, partial [marine sediment metagenome]
PKKRRQIRRQAEKRVGKRPAKDNEADLAAWQGEVSNRYAEMIKQEIESRNLLGRQRVHEELLLLSEWWRPFDRTSASESHIAYRESSREVFADAISVLLNSPGTLQEHAPMFFESFLAYMERKPEVEEAYEAIQKLIGGGDEAIYEARRAEIAGDFARGEQIQREAEARKDPQSLYQHFKQSFLSRGDPVVSAERKRVRAEGRVPAHSEKHVLKMALQEYNHGDNVNRIMLMDLSDKVHKPMLEADISPDQAGTYLMLQRIAEGDRGGMAEHAKEAIMEITGKDSWAEARKAYQELEPEDAEFDAELLAQAEGGILNPKGYTPKEARKTLEGLKKELGDEKYATLESLMKELRPILFASVEEAVRVGSYNEQVFNDVIVPNKETYVPYAVLDYFNGRMPAGVKQQMGTVKGIANPYTMAIMKAMALNRLNERQKAVTALVDILDVDFPGMAGGERKIDKHHRETRPGAGRENLTYLVDGKLRYREVDKYIARVLQQSDLGVLGRMAKTLGSKTYGFFHPLYVTWSVGWQARNLPR